MKGSFVAFFIFILIAGATWKFVATPGFMSDAEIIKSNSKQRTITIRNSLPVYVAVANTDALRVQGLSGLKRLEDEHGLLMIFPEDQKIEIWMKDMHFSIDVIWADSTGRITTIFPNMTPESYPRVFSSKVNARYVLEVPAGYVEIHNISVGDSMQI